VFEFPKGWGIGTVRVEISEKAFLEGSDLEKLELFGEMEVNQLYQKRRNKFHVL
jgi:hypothetical protein